MLPLGHLMNPVWHMCVIFFYFACTWCRLIVVQSVPYPGGAQQSADVCAYTVHTLPTVVLNSSDA
jgi:hypothetical protein